MKPKQLLLFLLALMGGITAHAYDIDVNGVYYNITDAEAKTVEVTYVENGEGNADFYYGNITIPKRISKDGVNYTVAAIGDYAFANCGNLTGVTIGENVTSIGQQAFYYTGLTSIIIPEGVTSIGDKAFQGCKALESITLPTSVATIGSMAFYGCCALTSFTFPEGVTEIGNMALGSNAGNDAYLHLTDVYLPSTLTEINMGMFEGWGSTEVTNLHYNGTLSDYCNKLAGDGFDRKHLYLQGNLLEGTLVIPGDVEAIPIGAFQGIEDITSLQIPNTVKTIGYQAFYGCTNLESVTLPDDGEIEFLPHECFGKCKKLSSINIPSSITTFQGQGTFSGTSLTSFEIPATVSSLSQYMFWNCKALQSLVINGTIETFPTYICSGCYNLRSLVLVNTEPPVFKEHALEGTTCPIFVPNESVNAYKAADGWSEFADRIQPQTGWTFTAAVPCGEGTADLTFKVTSANPWEVEVSASPEDIAGALTIPATVQHESGIKFAVKAIGTNAFKDRQGITSVVIEEGVKVIGYYAFENDANITSVLLPKSTTSIYGASFFACSKLSSINIPASVKLIDHQAFRGCSALKNIELPEGLTQINSHAFRGSGLESITFPSTLTRVDVAAFRDCSVLKTIDFNGCTATLEAEVFLGTAIEELVIPETVILKGWTNFGWCGQLKSVEMKNVNQTAHHDVFKACGKLETAILPKIAVMTTGYFENCTNLRSVTFLSGAPGNDGRQYCGKNFIDVPEDVLFIVPEGTAESYLKSGYKNLSDKSGLPLVREEFEAEAARITTMAEALNDGDKTALNTAITSARTTVNSTDDYMTIYAQIAAIKTAAKTFLTTASLPNEFDVTAAAITNPDFDRFQMGWKTTGGGEKRGWMGEPGYYHVENGDVILDYFIEAWNFRSYVNDGELSQTITSLPAGIYRLEADIIATNQNDANAEVTGVSLFAGNQSTPVATENQKPQHFSFKFENTLTKDVTIGININGTNANWVAMDNVRLIYEGKAADIPQGVDLASDENARVYLYNVETGKYLSAGHSWGIHAMLDETGLPVRLTQNAETGLWQVYFWEGSKSDSDQLLFSNYSNPEEEVCVNYYHGNPNADEDLTLWRITQTGDGSYLIQNKKYLDTEFYLGNIPTRQDYQENYSGISYTDIISKASVNDNSHWLIFTKENSDQLAAKHRLMAAILRMEASDNVNDELLAAARTVYNNADATAAEVIDIITQLNSQMGMPAENQPVDMTALIINPRFENNTTEGWSGANVVGGRTDATSNHEQEFYEKDFNMYQTITGVPNGIYRLKWKGFHRPGSCDQVYNEFNAGTNNASAVVYANNTQKTMLNWATGSGDADLGDWQANGVFYPNTMEAARRHFDAGLYADFLEVEVTDNVLTIGVKNTEPMASKHWVIFSDFELYIMENAEQAHNKLVASSAKGLSGGKATLPINMTNQDAIAGIQFKVKLPEGMTLNTNANGTLKVSKTTRTNALNHLSASDRGDYYQVLAYGIDQSVAPGTGAIAKLELNIAEELGLGEYEVEIYDVVLSNMAGLRIRPFSTQSIVTLVDAEVGDANHDGEVDVADIIAIANHILGTTPDKFDETAANVNGDEDIDVADIIGVANIILNGKPSSVKARYAERRETDYLDPQ